MDHVTNRIHENLQWIIIIMNKSHGFSDHPPGVGLGKCFSVIVD